MDEHNQSWIGRSLSVTSSTDPTLVGRKGIVVNETRNTIALLEGAQRTVLNTTSIVLTVCNRAVVLPTTMWGPRPEYRIHRTARKERYDGLIITRRQ